MSDILETETNNFIAYPTCQKQKQTISNTSLPENIFTNACTMHTKKEFGEITFIRLPT